MIYQPKGKAREYAELALNIYNGCTHACKYCFNDKNPWKKEFFKNANPKDDILKKIVKSIKKLNTTENCPEVLISFVGDPYQPVELELELTRTAIGILKDFEIPYTILTKGGLRAMRDFNILKASKASFGSTIVFYKESKMSREWEPYAPTYYDRVEAIKKATSMGIPTWVSMEPVIDPEQAIKIFKDLHPIVDHWKVGKINYFPEIEKQHDWISFRERIIDLLESKNSSYYIKKSLSEL